MELGAPLGVVGVGVLVGVGVGVLVGVGLLLGLLLGVALTMQHNLEGPNRTRQLLCHSQPTECWYGRCTASR